jgi:hypothetical protein
VIRNVSVSAKIRHVNVISIDRFGELIAFRTIGIGIGIMGSLIGIGI